jgi:hypothetical protein
MAPTLRRPVSFISAAAVALGLALLTGRGYASAAPVSPAGPASPAGTWGKAIPIPGLAKLDVGGGATIYSVSCPAPGDCSAGGWFLPYADAPDSTDGFIVSQRDGRWENAFPIPGAPVANIVTAGRPARTGGPTAVPVVAAMDDTAIRGGAMPRYTPASLGTLSSEILSVSCPAPGGCAAGGDYDNYQASRLSLVLSQRRGQWTDAIEVPGTAALGDENGQLLSISCPSAGNCGAGGTYSDFHNNNQAYVVSQRSGRWRTAIEVPGTNALNTGGYASVWWESCPSAGNCTAGGYYKLPPDNFGAFLADQRGGTWHKAFVVPGLAALNADKDANVYSISCPSVGNCVAGGYYESGSGFYNAYVIDQRHGTWGSAQRVPGTASPSIDGSPGAAIDSLSCASAGNCSAGGYYTTSSGRSQAFVLTQRNGRWGREFEVPGTAALNQGGLAQVFSVSCASPGNCAAGGYYTDEHGHSQAFLVNQRDGRWGTAFEVAGSNALNRGGSAAVNTVSCPRPGRCSAAGYYAGSSGSHASINAFVVTEAG